MKTGAVAIVAIAAWMSASACAESTIYKHVDESGRVTYSNKPMKGGTVVELEPLTTIPTPPAVLAAKSNFTLSDANGSPPRIEKASLTLDKPAKAKPVAQVTPIGPTAMLSVDVQTQRKRDDDRRRILEQELGVEQQSLDRVRASIREEQQNPELVAAVRALQQASDAPPSQMVQLRNDLDRVSGRIRGLQATASEHEQNVEALRKELAALK
ncbi:MAG TPA: DUF4124 domain-containing protein [Usitatibacter sp.]|jgi:hypothetical protein|nr:DUF4124 domain-containing protein [Usitatibacter sp.]